MVQYFGLQSNTCKALDVPSASAALCGCMTRALVDTLTIIYEQLFDVFYYLNAAICLVSFVCSALKQMCTYCSPGLIDGKSF